MKRICIHSKSQILLSSVQYVNALFKCRHGTALSRILIQSKSVHWANSMRAPRWRFMPTWNWRQQAVATCVVLDKCTDNHTHANTNMPLLATIAICLRLAQYPVHQRFAYSIESNLIEWIDIWSLICKFQPIFFHILFVDLVGRMKLLY